MEARMLQITKRRSPFVIISPLLVKQSRFKNSSLTISILSNSPFLIIDPKYRLAYVLLIFSKG